MNQRSIKTTLADQTSSGFQAPAHSYRLLAEQRPQKAPDGPAVIGARYRGPRQTQEAKAIASFSRSSPELYISIRISEPPMNSLFTYTCGIVGQSENSLIP